MQHLIKKQQLFLSINQELDAFTIQHLASHYYWHAILPALEKIFDSLSNEDEIIELDKLEIDLGVIQEKNIHQNELANGLYSKLEKDVREILLVSSSKNNIVREPMPISICRQWLFYMQRGFIPWNAIHIDEQWYKNVLEVLAGDFETVTTLRNIILTDETVARRIIFQHNESFLIDLIEILTAQSQMDLPTVLNELYELFNFLGKQNISLTPVDGKQFKRKLWKQVLNMAAISEKDLTPATLSQKIISRHIPESLILRPIPTEVMQKLKIISPVFSALRDKLSNFKKDPLEEIQKNKEKSEKRKSIKQEKISEKNKKKEDHSQINNAPDNLDLKKGKPAGKFPENTAEPLRPADKQETHSDELIRQKETKKGPERKQEKDTPKIENKSSETKITDDQHREQRTETTDNLFDAPTVGNKEFNLKAIDEEGIFVHHAGIILIHPFLTTLFNRLHLTEENRFVNQDARLKALQLLHYLGTGNMESEEFELVVPKLLCNYSLNEPVPKEINLTSNEQLEADDMLTAAIEQWDKIKNTSVEALRESFLQRKGKLFMKNDSPYLQVETHAIDVLLDYLPWNLSIIKLPWMKEMLHVEWR